LRARAGLRAAAAGARARGFFAFFVPDSTLSGSSSTTSNAEAGRASSSFSLMSSHGSWRSSPRALMRTRFQRPRSFSPCMSNLSLPAR
jgi:hypothetical protein